MGQQGNRGQATGVIHIGFLSSTKILSLNRNLYASAESALRSGDVGLVFCCATFTSRTAAGVRLCLAPASSLYPIRRVRLPLRRLFRAVIHPDLGRASCDLWSQDPAPSRHRRDQNNVSTVPCSIDVHPEGRTNRPNELSHPTKRSPLRDSGHGRKRIHRPETPVRLCTEAMRRPSNQALGS